MPHSHNLGMDRIDTHPMPLNGLEKIGNREAPIDEVFRPWAETMPAPDPADETPRRRPSRGRGLAVFALTVSLVGLVVHAVRKLFQR